MYRRPKFLEILDEIREEMSREANYDVVYFSEILRTGKVTTSPENFVGGEINFVKNLLVQDLLKTEK